MRILFVSRSTTYHFASGGMETQLKNLMEGLVSEGHEVTVLTTSFPSDDRLHNINNEDQTFDSDGVKYVFIGNTTPGLLPLRNSEKLFYSLGLYNSRKVKEGKLNFFNESVKYFGKNGIENYDILISQSTVGKSIIAEYGDRIRNLVIIHGTAFGELKNRFRTLSGFKSYIRYFLIDWPALVYEHYTSNNKLFNETNAVVAVSNALKEEFLEQYPQHVKKVHVIKNGVDDKYFTPMDNKQKTTALKILYIGRVVLEKGIDLIIKTAANLAERNVNFTIDIVGDGRNLNDMKTLAEKLNVTSQVKFLGQVKNDEIVKYYQQSNIFLFPTRRIEGHPMIISEAMLCGLPVISTKNGGLRDLILDGHTGYFVEDENVDQITDRLVTLASNHELLDKLSMNAREYGLKNFSSHAMVEQYLFLLNNLIS